jgi:hypothetical protein
VLVIIFTDFCMVFLDFVLLFDIFHLFIDSAFRLICSLLLSLSYHWRFLQMKEYCVCFFFYLYTYRVMPKDNRCPWLRLYRIAVAYCSWNRIFEFFYTSIHPMSVLTSCMCTNEKAVNPYMSFHFILRFEVMNQPCVINIWRGHLYS